MDDSTKITKRGGWIAGVFFVWLVMNIRVAAGIGSVFERALDGLVGVALLVATVIFALDFFQLMGKNQR